jgi:CheY-like chemotaxis protein
MTARNPAVLLIEDNEDDIFLMRRALKKLEVNLPLQVAKDGQEAIDYLDGKGKFFDRVLYPMPSLIFLDLKLPYVHGFEVLSWIRQQDSLQKLPVVVLTSSPEERDRQRAHELGARAYLVKPPDREMLLTALQLLDAAQPKSTRSA